MQQGEKQRRTVVRHYGSHYLNRHEDVTLRQYRLAAKESSEASQELLERTRVAFARFGRRYGISTEEARHLLLNTGVRL